MSTGFDSAHIIEPPREGSITRIAVSTSASTLQSSPVTAGKRKVRFEATVASGITFNAIGATTVTDPSLTSTSGGSQCADLPANSPREYDLVPSDKFKLIGSASGYVVVVVSGV